VLTQIRKGFLIFAEVLVCWTDGVRKGRQGESTF